MLFLVGFYFALLLFHLLFFFLLFFFFPVSSVFFFVCKIKEPATVSNVIPHVGMNVTELLLSQPITGQPN